MIAISSCIVGEACRFDGGNQDVEEALILAKYGSVIKVCPEILGGLTVPRAPAEIRMVEGNKRVITIDHVDVTPEFELGAAKTLELCLAHNCHYVILKDRSPSCGKGQIYNGDFEGVLVSGNGLTSQLLLEHSIEVYNSSQAPYKKLMVYDFLNENQIKFEKFTHQPVFTVEEAETIQVDMKAQHCKNLFLETKNKKTKLLIILPFDQRFNFKKTEKAMSITKLKFASKKSLKDNLGVDPGSVGAFALLYNQKRDVKVIISNQFKRDERITFHPNINNETLSIDFKDFMRYLTILGYDPIFVDLEGE